MKKLSPQQQELYDAMVNGTRVFFMDGSTAYYFRSDNHKRCTPQVMALLKAGLLETYEQSPFSNKHKIRVKAKP